LKFEPKKHEKNRKNDAQRENKLTARDTTPHVPSPTTFSTSYASIPILTNQEQPLKSQNIIFTKFNIHTHNALKLKG